MPLDIKTNGLRCLTSNYSIVWSWFYLIMLAKYNYWNNERFFLYSFRGNKQKRKRKNEKKKKKANVYIVLRADQDEKTSFFFHKGSTL